MSREYEALLSALKEPLFPAGDPLEVAREKLEAVHGHEVASDTRVEWTGFSGVSCAWVDAAASGDSQRILMLCHGGAYIAACGDGYLF